MPHFALKIKTLGQEAKYLQEKVGEFEDKENQDASQFMRVKNALDNTRRESHHWKNEYATMF